MRRFHAIAFAVLVAASTQSVRAEAVPQLVQVLGSVTTAARPVANALVIALNLQDLDAIQTYSGPNGQFTLPPLPQGIYKIIAVKQGFLPAIATVVPSRANRKVKLALENEKNTSKSKQDEMWEIRASLPPDILRELDDTLNPAQPASAAAGAKWQLPRFRAEMVSLTGVSDQPASAAFAQTSLGVQSRIGENWQLGFRGNIHRIDDPTDSDHFGMPAAQSSGMSMELRSSPTEAYRVASTKSFFRYRDAAPADAQADIRSHNFEWEHGAARVGVRYLAQDNLFASNPVGSDLIEITGGTTVLQTRHNDVGVSLRVTQESIRNSTAASLRTADITATGSFSVAAPLQLKYGLSTRVAVDGTELAPRTGAELKIGKDTVLVTSGMYKVIDPLRQTALPMVVVSGDDRVLPRYAYSFGIISGDEGTTRLSAIATVTAIESPLRVILNDGMEQFWDGFYIDSGDVRRDVRVSWRKDFGSKLAVDVSSSAGTATPAGVGATKAYVTGEVQSIFLPTGTTLLISYRGIQQPQDHRAEYRSKRMNVRMAQPLHLPLDLKVLVGVEMAKAENSPFLLDTLDPTNTAARRYIGGLAMSF